MAFRFHAVLQTLAAEPPSRILVVQGVAFHIVDWRMEADQKMQAAVHMVFVPMEEGQTSKPMSLVVAFHNFHKFVPMTEEQTSKEEVAFRNSV